jgi:hypothetical protein
MTTNSKFDKSLNKSLEVISEADFHTDDEFGQNPEECGCQRCASEFLDNQGNEIACDCTGLLRDTGAGLILCEKHFNSWVDNTKPEPTFHTDDQFEECGCEVCPEICDCEGDLAPTFEGIICQKHRTVPSRAELQFHTDDEFSSNVCGCEACEGEPEADGEHPGAMPCGCDGDEIDTETSAGILCKKHYDSWMDRMSSSYPDPMESIGEGMAPMSHDNTLMRKIRKHKTPRSRRHMKGSNRYRLPDPAKKVKARLKRDSRHQNRPEVEEAFSFLKKYSGKPITESNLEEIKDRNLFIQAVDFLAAMSLGGWVKSEEGITNGHFIIEDETPMNHMIGLKIKDGHLTYHNSPLKLDWNWLYSVKELLQKKVSNG